MKMTSHLTNDRSYRVEFIEKYIGWGEIAYRFPHQRADREICLTTTGIILICDKDEKFIITAYLANVCKVESLMKLLYPDLNVKTPSKMAKQIMKNEKLAKKYHYHTEG